MRAWTGALAIPMLLACGQLGRTASVHPAPEGAPNVLFVVSDDQRADSIAALGNPHIATPHLDSLVESGFSFTRAYCQGSTVAAVCAPSRAMLLSGKSLFRLEGSVYDQRDTDPILPEHLRRSGWTTHGTGKWHNGRQWFRRAFDRGDAIFHGGMGPHRGLPVHHFDPTGAYSNAERHATATFSSTEFADATLAFIEWLGAEERDGPFMAYVSFTAPHDPRTPPGEYRAMYDPDDMPVPPNYLDMHPFDNGDIAVRDELLAPWPRMPEIVQRHVADYYGMISHMDAELGRILSALEAAGERERTLVVFLSDHGLSLGGHGLMGKQNLYEDSMRAPLVITGPGVPVGSSDALVYLFDVYPTLCELLELEAPAGLEGRSLVPVIRGERPGVREAIFTAYLHVQRAVRDARWKLIEYPLSGETQLFDLEQDPFETIDLAEDPEHGARLELMRGLLASQQAEFADPLVEGR